MLLGLNNVTDILERAADDLNVAVGRRLRGGQGGHTVAGRGVPRP
jgi:hypothetical protein